MRNDIKAARKLWLPWWAVLTLMVIMAPIFPILDHFGKLNMALPLISCVTVLALLIYIKWGLRRQPLFWTMILLLALVHAVLIWYIPWTSRWVPALVTAGISSLDFYLMLWILVAIEMRLHERVTAKS